MVFPESAQRRSMANGESPGSSFDFTSSSPAHLEPSSSSMYLDSPVTSVSDGCDPFKSEGLSEPYDYDYYWQNNLSSTDPPTDPYSYAAILQQMQVDTPDVAWRSPRFELSPGELSHPAASGRSAGSDMTRYIICDSPTAPTSPTIMAVDRRQAKTAQSYHSASSSHAIPSVADQFQPSLALRASMRRKLANHSLTSLEVALDQHQSLSLVSFRPQQNNASQLCNYRFA